MQLLEKHLSSLREETAGVVGETSDQIPGLLPVRGKRGAGPGLTEAQKGEEMVM